MTVGRFIRNTFILTGVMLAVWAFLSGMAAGLFGEVAPEAQTPISILLFFAIVLAIGGEAVQETKAGVRRHFKSAAMGRFSNRAGLETDCHRSFVRCRLYVFRVFHRLAVSGSQGVLFWQHRNRWIFPAMGKHDKSRPHIALSASLQGIFMGWTGITGYRNNRCRQEMGKAHHCRSIDERWFEPADSLAKSIHARWSQIWTLS